MGTTRTTSIVVLYGVGRPHSIPERAEPLQNEVDAQQGAAGELEPNWLTAVRAAESKKAQSIVVLDLREITSFTDYFVICTGTNARQNQAISDEVYAQLKQRGELPVSLEGYDNAEWVLQDYGDFIVHVFLPQTRDFYDLERLWRHAKKLDVPQAVPGA